MRRWIWLHGERGRTLQVQVFSNATKQSFKFSEITKLCSLIEISWHLILQTPWRVLKTLLAPCTAISIAAFTVKVSLEPWILITTWQQNKLSTSWHGSYQGESQKKTPHLLGTSHLLFRSWGENTQIIVHTEKLSQKMGRQSMKRGRVMHNLHHILCHIGTSHTPR